jgi:hypothetical protein
MFEVKTNELWNEIFIGENVSGSDFTQSIDLSLLSTWGISKAEISEHTEVGSQ